MRKNLYSKRVIAILIALIIVISSLSLAITIASAENDSENEVVFAKLDGSEYPIVSPGLGTTASETKIDRSLNFTPSGNVKEKFHIARSNVKSPSKLDPVDFSKMNYLSFILTVEDNGAWKDYKNYIQIRFTPSSGSNIFIPDADVAAGLSKVIPGQTQKIEISLKNMDKTKLTSIKQMSFFVTGGTSDLNLNIKMTELKGVTTSEEVKDTTVYPINFAKLDGTEYPIVTPGFGDDKSQTTVDRSLNFTENANVKSKFHIARMNVTSPAKLDPVDFSGADLLTFVLTVEDNGAWEYYKNYIQIRFTPSSGSNIFIPDADVAAGLSKVIPGQTQKIEISLKNVDKTKIKSIKQLSFFVSGSTCDLNLKVKITDINADISNGDDDEGDVEEDGSVETQVIAKLNGTEWPICHPGLKGEVSGSADYDAKYFDRYFSGTPSGDVRVGAYISRKAAKLSEIDATKHNLLTFDFIAEDTNAWNTYKDGMEIKIRTTDNQQISFPKSVVNKAFENVIPGTKCRIVLSLVSIGKKNLGKVDGIYIGVGETVSEKKIHIKVTNVCVEYSDEYPEVSYEPVIEEEEKDETTVLFAKLDGTEFPIVHPGLKGTISGSANYDAMNFDRYLNFDPDGDIKNKVNVIRTEKYKNDPSDFSKCNVISFNIFIENNGAWNDYKNKIKVSLTSTDNVIHPLSSADVSAAFSKIVPGEWCEVSISLAGLHKGELKNITTVGFTLKDGKSKKNLHIKVIKIVGEYKNEFPTVPDEPKNDDPTLILNDEYGERAWPATVTSDIHKFGNKSYEATTYVNSENNHNEGWLIRMGFMSSTNKINRPLNISTLTHNGTKGAIRFWVYAEDAETVRRNASAGSGSFCRYGSTRSWDTDLFEWKGWDKQIIYNGWNEIVLPFENATKRGNPDLTNMASFGLKFGEDKKNEPPKTTIYIDDIRISQNATTSLPTSYEPTIKGAKMFQAFEETMGLRSETKLDAFELDINDKTQGMASLKFVTKNSKFVWTYKRGNDLFDATGYNAVEFDLYVSHPEFFEYAGGSIEFTSSGTWDQNEMSWSLKELKLKKGWNHVKLSFDFATYTMDWKGQRDIDLKAINFMRLYSNGSDNYIDKEVVFKIDNMCFTKNGDTKIEKSIITTNDTGYELYLTAKPNVIPEYGEIVVKKEKTSILPDTVRSQFESNKNTVIITPTYYKDSIEYLFDDTVTVHLSQSNMTGYKNKYVYRLDVNGSVRKLTRIDNRSKNELVWDEETRLASYIISDVLIENDELISIESQLHDKSSIKKLSLPLIIGFSVGGLAVLAAVIASAFVIIRKNKIK